jgi:hypothetical protein
MPTTWSIDLADETHQHFLAARTLLQTAEVLRLLLDFLDKSYFPLQENTGHDLSYPISRKMVRRVALLLVLPLLPSASFANQYVNNFTDQVEESIL